MLGLVAWRSANKASKNSIFLFSFSSIEGFLVFPGIFQSEDLLSARGCRFYGVRDFQNYKLCLGIQSTPGQWTTACIVNDRRKYALSSSYSSPKHNKMTQSDINYSRVCCHVFWNTEVPIRCQIHACPAPNKCKDQPQYTCNKLQNPNKQHSQRPR